jgi:hypothetical protein
MSELLFPYQNQSLKSLDGERWKPIQGYEGLYEISSHGRVKSLKRERVLHHGGMMPLRERILTTRLGEKTNKSIGETLFSLIVTLNLEGIKYYHAVARLVYNAFIAPIDIKDRNTMISCKDGDGRNVYYKNLFATNISELRNTSYENGRFISSLREPVSQFDTNGKLIAQYSSMMEAETINGFEGRGISHAAGNTGNHLYKGFIWQRGYNKRLKNSSKLIRKIDVGITEALHPVAADETKAKLPSASLSLKNLQGERWKDFPGYEGMYCISNYGRVKSLARIGGVVQQKWYPGQIKKLTPSNHPTTPAGSTTSLIVTLSKDRRRKTVSVARYVYFSFVEEFDLTDPSIRIYYKDRNSHNPYYSNLVSVSAESPARDSAERAVRLCLAIIKIQQPFFLKERLL